MELVKVELVFDTIMGIQKHMDMWLDREISSAIFYRGLTVGAFWPLVWLGRPVVAWSFMKKKYSVRATATAKYPFAFHVNFSHRMLSLI